MGTTSLLYVNPRKSICGAGAHGKVLATGNIGSGGVKCSQRPIASGYRILFTSVQLSISVLLLGALSALIDQEYYSSFLDCDVSACAGLQSIHLASLTI